MTDDNIFIIPTDDIGKPGQCLVYAPFTDSVALATAEECRQLQHVMLHPNYANHEMAETLELLRYDGDIHSLFNTVENVDDFLLMYILPNNICNFSCSYCFSAKGRGSGVLDAKCLKAALDWFIDIERISSKTKANYSSPQLAISYLGGGEPTLSWPVVKDGLEYAASLAAQQGIKLITSIVTNGSRITDEMVETFSRLRVAPRVSFEILPQIQNLQRGHFDEVKAGLVKLERCTIPPMIRSMITPDNVELMEEMVEEVHKSYPAVRHLLMDPITSASVFDDATFTKHFYDLYHDHFIAAHKLAESYDIRLECAPLRNLELLAERFCTGEFCLTPQGTITVCHQVASPKENRYKEFQYARFDESTGRMVVDGERFHQLTTMGRVYDNPKCEKCFIKWNCGGGCLMQNLQYKPEVLDVICEATRRLSKHYLLCKAMSYTE